MLSREHKKYQRQWIKGKFNLKEAARRMGYEGKRMGGGMNHIRKIMKDMHIPIYG